MRHEPVAADPVQGGDGDGVAAEQPSVQVGQRPPGTEPEMPTSLKMLTDSTPASARA